MAHGIDRRHKHKRLTDEQVNRIRAAERIGVPRSMTSKIYKTTESNISYIVRKFTHK